MAGAGAAGAGMAAAGTAAAVSAAGAGAGADGAAAAGDAAGGGAAAASMWDAGLEQPAAASVKANPKIAAEPRIDRPPVCPAAYDPPTGPKVKL